MMTLEVKTIIRNWECRKALVVVVLKGKMNPKRCKVKWLTRCKRSIINSVKKSKSQLNSSLKLYSSLMKKEKSAANLFLLNKYLAHLMTWECMTLHSCTLRRKYITLKGYLARKMNLETRSHQLLINSRKEWTIHPVENRQVLKTQVLNLHYNYLVIISKLSKKLNWKASSWMNLTTWKTVITKKTGKWDKTIKLIYSSSWGSEFQHSLISSSQFHSVQTFKSNLKMKMSFLRISISLSSSILEARKIITSKYSPWKLCWTQMIQMLTLERKTLKLSIQIRSGTCTLMEMISTVKSRSLIISKLTRNSHWILLEMLK